MGKLETLLRGAKIFGMAASTSYLLFFAVSGVAVLFNIHPEHHALNVTNTVLGAVSFLMGMLAWFPRKYIYLVDEEEFRTQKRRPFAFYAAMSWTDGKVLMIRTYALAAVGVSVLIYGVLVILTLNAYS